MFMILKVYDDCSTSTERATDFCSALRSCEIALLDPTCCSVKIWGTADGNIILDYNR